MATPSRKPASQPSDHAADTHAHRHTATPLHGFVRSLARPPDAPTYATARSPA